MCNQYMLAFVSRTDMARWDRTRPLRERAFMFLVGMQSSYNEHKVLADVFQTTAVSAVRILKHERSLGNEPLILDGNSSNLTTTLQGLPLTQEQREEIVNRVMGQSFKLIIPTKSTSLEGWNGWGYILWDPNTGAGGYYISGGMAGGWLSGNMGVEFVIEMMKYDNIGKFYVVNFSWRDILGAQQTETFYLQAETPRIVMVYIIPEGRKLPSSVDLSAGNAQSWNSLPYTYYMETSTTMKVGGLCWSPANPKVLTSQILRLGENGGVFVNSIRWLKNRQQLYEGESFQYGVNDANIHLGVIVEQKTDNGGVALTAEVDIALSYIGLIPDYNRDGKIDSQDQARKASNTLFRFWVNDDKDEGAYGGSDDPSTTSQNFRDGFINGEKDLTDFFPVYFDFNAMDKEVGGCWRLANEYIIEKNANVNVVFATGLDKGASNHVPKKRNSGTRRGQSASN